MAYSEIKVIVPNTAQVVRVFAECDKLEAYVEKIRPRVKKARFDNKLSKQSSWNEDFRNLVTKLCEEIIKHTLPHCKKPEAYLIAISFIELIQADKSLDEVRVPESQTQPEETDPNWHKPGSTFTNETSDDYAPAESSGINTDEEKGQRVIE